MADLHLNYQNVFNDHETVTLRTAFDLAWDRLLAARLAADTDQMKQRLASALMVIAGSGETDPGAMASRAIERCAKGLF